MRTLQLIYYICIHPEYTTVVINGDEKTPIQAIEYLSAGGDVTEGWYVTGRLKNTLYIYPA